MARRRRKKSLKLKKEVVAIVLILITILGLGKFGIVGRVIDAAFVFLFGYIGLYIMLVTLLLVGIVLLFRKDGIDFFSTRMIGIYILIFSILVFLHLSFCKEYSNFAFMLNNTMSHLIVSFKNVVNNAAISDYLYAGGGLVGGVFSIVFVRLFSYTGMIIVTSILTLIGLVFVGGIAFLGSVKDKLVEIRDDLFESDDEEEESDEKKPVIITGDKDKIKITDISELTDKPNTENVPEKRSITNPNYKLPSLDLLDKPKAKQNETNQALVEKNIQILEDVLKDFGINGKVVEVHIGPTVAQYELEIASGTRVNKITSINREIALALAKKDVRIEAPIPGKKTVGIEFANDNPSPVSFYEIMSTKEMERDFDNKLLVPLGKTIMGEIGTCKINKMPHLLIAGTTGSGKSVCVNGIICSILMRATPEEVKLAMVDPKVVELSVYNGIPHLMCPVVSDPKKASVLLQKMVQEMENRYSMFGDTKTKNIETYNEYVEKYNKSHDDKKEKLPYVVIIIDELADLMMVAAKEVEDSILRITQKARAAGMHLIVATQRPSTEVITGLIKANIPSRISFAVSNGIDSRTILDQTGAEKLLGKGDMLYLPIGTNTPTRIQGSFIKDSEIKKVIDFVSSQQEAQYDDGLMNLDSISSGDNKDSGSIEADGGDLDPLYSEVVNFVVTTQKASASLIQRKFKVGYNRAGRIIDELEEQGIIGPQNGSKPREVLVTLDSTQEEENSEDNNTD
ncbi:MAG: cell division protein FtsK [Bacilli bacterium]|nr:cell division protein FtsK [Bacilli bacterium]